MNTVQVQEAPDAPAMERDYIAPEVNIFETPEGYLLEADMPGVDKSGIEVTLENNTLTLIGHRAQPDLPKAELLYRESRTADYRRIFELDPTIDAKKISAKMEQGVLTVTLPKAEKVKPRRIEIGE